MSEREALITAHLGLADEVARQFLRRGLSLDDLKQEARVALCKAADAFNPKAGTEFEYFALVWIRKYLTAKTMVEGVVKVPERLARAASKCRRAEARLMAAGDPHPSVLSIAEATGLSESLTQKAMGLKESESAIDEFGIVHPFPDVEKDKLADQLWDAVSLCDQVERFVLIGLFGLEGDKLSLSEVARRLNMSRWRTRIIATNALRVVGREFRSRGWTPDSWATAVAV